MLHQKQGNAPGIDTSIEKAAGVSQDSKRLKTDTSNALKIIALYNRTKGAMTGFYLDRGVSIESIVMVILIAVFAAIRGCHEL